MIVPIVHNPGNKFTVARVHYSLDPDKSTPEWLARAKEGMTEEGWRREYEIDYSQPTGKPFFPEFKEFNVVSPPATYKQSETLYRGWDFGFHRPAVLVTRLNEFDQWCWLEAILGRDEGIMEFGKRIRNHCLATYPGAKYIDACDPAGMQVSDKSERTSVQILNNLGIFPQSRKQPTKMGAEIIRQKLRMRVDGKPGLVINPDQTDLIDGFKGGLHYPEAKNASVVTYYDQDQGKEVSEKLYQDEHYQKDGFYEHLFDAARYLATEMFTVIGQTESQNQLTQDPLKHMWRDGRSASEQNPQYGDTFAPTDVDKEMQEFF